MSARLRRIWFLLGTVLPLWLRTWRRPVLFVRPGALGDILCTFPAALELKKRHPGAAFIYCCHRDFTCLPRLGEVTPHVTSAYFAPKSRWNFLLSAVYHFDYADEQPGSASTETIIAEFCRQHGVPVTDSHPRLHVDPKALSRVKSRLADLNLHGGPLAILHLGPSWPVREWPRDAWVSLIQELKRHGTDNVIQVGAGKHVQLGKVQDTAIPEAMSLVGRLTLEETIALISLGQLFVGIDSGLLHIAAALRTPAVGIFGATSPRFRFSTNSSCAFVVSRVECQGCHHRMPRLHWMTGCPYDIRCMKAISTKEVLAACLSQLKAGRTAVAQ